MPLGTSKIDRNFAAILLQNSESANSPLAPPRERLYDEGVSSLHRRSPRFAPGLFIFRNHSTVSWRLTMQLLIRLIQQCEDDTERLLGHGAATRLGNWRKHTDSSRDLTEYVQKLLWGEHCDNGKKLDRQDGLSLERIVLAFPETFGDPDIQQARRTLGL
jgi:hypothetical protein